MKYAFNLHVHYRSEGLHSFPLKSVCDRCSSWHGRKRNGFDGPGARQRKSGNPTKFSGTPAPRRWLPCFLTCLGCIVYQWCSCNPFLTPPTIIDLCSTVVMRVICHNGNHLSKEASKTVDRAVFQHHCFPFWTFISAWCVRHCQVVLTSQTQSNDRFFGMPENKSLDANPYTVTLNKTKVKTWRRFLAKQRNN